MTDARAQRLTRNVLRNSEQPGRELRLFAQRFQAPISSHESFLRQLFSQVAIANLIVDETDHRSRVPLKYQTERILIALARTRAYVHLRMQQRSRERSRLAFQA